MSGPQLEDGYTRIANELLEEILRFGFSARELLVLFAIIRKTYGYGKKTDDISASQIGDACKIARQHVTSTLNSLAARNVITKTSGRFGSMIGIQKNHSKWVSLERTKPAPASPESGQGCPEMGQGCPDLGHVPNRFSTSPESGQVDSPESGHTKENLPKENQQKKVSSESMSARFEKFYEAYPKKEARGRAVKAFARLKPDDDLLNAILAGIELAKKSRQWQDRKFIPQPASWLNAEGWMDQIQVEYTEEELVVINLFNKYLGDQLGVVDAKLFIESRASAIQAFVKFSEKEGFVERIFPWIRKNVELPPHVGFDWIISPEGYSNTTGGQHTRKES